ncbi:hypothetical protein [Sphingobacterium cellulitidis]|uniref:hypothetical protein n=1 Tax=Sphingobacterium cellulitidis TaxID=1768011 RepID=UPI0011818E3E|nr:hypothetical protein [Sphingobacterium cellulitidis]
MKAIRTIYTIDARENVYLESMAEAMKLDNETVHDVIGSMFEELLNELKKVKINYSDLKNCLTPQKKKREIAFVFDSVKTESDMYGARIITKLFSIFDKKSCNSVLVGDLIGSRNAENVIRDAFFHFLVKEKEVNYLSNDLFFIVYINNLSDFAFNNIRQTLVDYKPYIGYLDLTYSNPFKHYLSTILIRNFIKDRDQVITPDEDTGYHNPTWYSFEDHGFKCKAINSLYYGLFLSYKIERPAMLTEEDIRFSLNAVSSAVFRLSDFNLVIEEPKLQYLVSNKRDNLERAGMLDMSIDELQHQIKIRINTNYIFNLCILKEYHTVKFNIMLESGRKDSDNRMKLEAALEYRADDKILRLITMF